MSGTPTVHHVLQIRNPSQVYERFCHYAEQRGNVCRRFHGTSTHANCFGGLDLDAQPCQKTACAVCNICRVGFSLATLCTRRVQRDADGLGSVGWASGEWAAFD